MGADTPVVVGSHVVVKSASKTRPNNTDTYAAGEVINESTSAGTVMTFENCVREPGGSGVIGKVMIDDSISATLKLLCELWLFDTAPAAATIGYDNAAFAPTDAEMQTVVAVVPVSVSFVGGANVLLTSGAVNNPFKCAAGSKTLYGVLVTRNAYVPAANEVFNTRIHIYQD